MKPILIIGNKNYSSWSMRAWLVLKKVGVDFEEIPIALDTEGYQEKILRYSRAGQVPIYKEDDLVVWDSLAICEYLADAWPSLWPDSPRVRAVARAVSAEMHSGFGALRNALPMNCRAAGRRVRLSEEVGRDVERITEIWESCRQAHALEGPWLFGRFSIADALYAPVVMRFVTYGISCPAASREYMETVLGDDAVAQWIAEAREEKEVIESEEVGRPAGLTASGADPAPQSVSAQDPSPGSDIDRPIPIRVFQEDDAAPVISLWKQVFADNKPHNDPARVVREKRAIQPDLFFVATNGAAIVGTLMAGYDGHRGWLYALAVAPGYRRQGIGSALVRHAEAALAALGCGKINLQVRASNYQVVAFYRSLGFASEARISLGKLVSPDAAAGPGTGPWA
jgi:glutathione S-transferase